MEEMEGKKGLPDLIRKAVELTQPDMRHYYRMTKKAKVVASYASDGKYYADVQPLRNDETVDDAEPVVPKVEIPIMWAGPKRGVVCPPTEGTFCDLSYYDGDPNYPRISNFRWHAMDAPEAALNEFVIQLEPGVEIRIDKQKHIVTLTPENVRTEAGKNWTILVGEHASITAGSTATVTAPQITLVGNLTATGTGGGTAAIFEIGDRNHLGDYTQTGDRNHQGNHTQTGDKAQQGNYALTGDMTISGTLRVGGTVTAPLFDGPAKGIV